MSGRDRVSGVFLHISSLPSALDGIGTLGAEAKQFVDFLTLAGQKYWQILPVGPTGDGCPYMASSAFAGNPMLIDLASLEQMGDLEASDLASYRPPSHSADRVDFQWLAQNKLPLLRRACENFLSRGEYWRRRAFEEFCHDNQVASWLRPYASFAALKRRYEDAPWIDWPREWRRYGPELPAECSNESVFQCYLQWMFHVQWTELRNYIAARGIKLIGDAPIFVAYDSADVWANRELFNLDDEGHRITISGAPPDPYSPTGQVWCHPHYRWDVMARDGYQWWMSRLRNEMQRVDLLRIDHFRALSAESGYWEISARELESSNPTAAGYHWAPGPGDAFLRAAEEAIGPGHLIVEDLGQITDDVPALRDRFGLPGMRVMQFADWGSPALHGSMHAPHCYPENSVGYASTHDSNTFRGWFMSLDDWHRGSVLDYLYGDWQHPDQEIHWRATEVLLGSRPWLSLLMAVDLLGLGSEGRLNVPATVGSHNWSWRLNDLGRLTAVAGRLRDLTSGSGRLHNDS